MRMLTPFSISQGVTGQSAVWCRVKKSRALNSCQQHALAPNQRTNANNTGRGTINRSVVAPLQPRTSERRAPERQGRAAGRSVVDPCHKHTEKLKLVMLIPDDFFLLLFLRDLSLCFKTNLALTLTAWSDSTLVGSEQEPTLSGVLYTVVCWRWQLNFDGRISAMGGGGGGHHDCDTPLVLCLCSNYSCQREGRLWGKPATSRS